METVRKWRLLRTHSCRTSKQKLKIFILSEQKFFRVPMIQKFSLIPHLLESITPHATKRMMTSNFNKSLELLNVN